MFFFSVPNPRLANSESLHKEKSKKKKLSFIFFQYYKLIIYFFFSSCCMLAAIFNLFLNFFFLSFNNLYLKLVAMDTFKNQISLKKYIFLFQLCFFKKKNT